jgi:hypothetical protein
MNHAVNRMGQILSYRFPFYHLSPIFYCLPGFVEIGIIVEHTNIIDTERRSLFFIGIFQKFLYLLYGRRQQSETGNVILRE